MRFAAEFIGSNYAEFASDHRTLVKANLACAEHFGFDQVSCISDPYRETEGFGGKIDYITDGPPRCTRPLEDSKDLALLKNPDPVKSVRMKDRLDAAALYLREVRRAYSILGWVEGPAAEAADLRGVENFLFDLLDDPHFAGNLMDKCVDVAVEFGTAQISRGCDTIGIGDAIVSQVSPGLYRDLIFPRQKKIVDAVHSAGGLGKLHICGNITHLLPDIAGLGVDILDCDHMVDLSNARKIMGPRTILTGNLDPVNDILRGTPSAIRAKVKECFNAAGTPYMVNAGCEIPSGTPEENLRALCEPVGT